MRHPCPVCGRPQHHNDVQSVLRRIKAPVGVAAVSEGRWRQWACPRCLAEGRAVIAKVNTHHHLPTMGPDVAYIFLSHERRCKVCRDPFTFSAREQQHWYEVLRIPLEVGRVRCDPCQRKHVAGKRLSERVPGADPNNIDHAVALARDFAIIGAEEKRRYWQGRVDALEALGHTPTPPPRSPRAKAEEKAAIKDRIRSRRRQRRER